MLGFWDEVAEAIIECQVRILVGDLHIVSWCVFPELRARGLQANLAAWYPWKHHDEGKNRTDSTAMFVIGPCVGAHKIFGVETIMQSAVAECAPPKGWETLLEPIYDDKGKIVERRPYPLPAYGLLGQGFPLASYRPQVLVRMEQLVAWTFTLAIDKYSPAVVGTCARECMTESCFPDILQALSGVWSLGLGQCCRR